MIALLLSTIMILAAAGETIQADEVRISVLSLLKPQRISLESAAESSVTIDSAGHPVTIRLHPGEKITISVRMDALDAVIESESESRTFSYVDSISAECQTAGGNITVVVEEPSPFRREFAGRITVTSDGGNLLIVLTARLEQVVGEITAAEMGSGAGDQAMMAQAVAVRSYILAAEANHDSEKFDLCDTSHCLLYRSLEGAFGAGSNDILTRAMLAAKKTAGMVLVYGGKVVPGYFQPCCGGLSATPQMIWGSDTTGGAFVQVACDLCRQSTHYRWRRQVRLATLMQVFLENGEDQAGWALNAEHYPGSPFVSQVLLQKDGENNAVFPPDDFKLKIGRALGWDVVRSNAWSVTVDGDFAVFSGSGFGHGVGLCQEGAKAADSKGWNWRKILEFYYPRCSIQLHR